MMYLINRKLTSNRSIPIRVVAPIISFAQMKVHIWGFNRTKAVFSIRTLPAEEKTEQFFLLKNEIHIFKPIRVLTSKNPFCPTEV